MTSERFPKLVTLLKELFQLDKPELDFGFYRVMHARSAEVTRFLEEDLKAEVQAALGEYGSAERDQVERELRKATAQAKSLGVDPDSADKVHELRAKLNEADDLAAVEADVYDHLYRFFRRYYKDGDFISQRVYKDGAYAIPYAGEEVKLHWANADQYYIKTDEYLRNYSFRLRPDDPADPMRVHLRLADAAEGEHDNVKAAEGKKRVFILADDDFASEEAGENGARELILRFEYRPATLDDWPDVERAGKKKPPTQKPLIELAESRIGSLSLSQPSLRRWVAVLEQNHPKHRKADGDTSKKSHLRVHLERYTARNTFDYFIHKDLGGFLRRELDFYIKNEVMRLDDIENADAPKAEQYLSRIRAIRRSALPVIDFLASLENFQKRLWLKKKFVVETSYCIRLGCIPDEFLPEIAANEAQRREWVDLRTIKKTERSSPRRVPSRPLTVDLLRAEPALVLDTRNFRASFVQRLIASFPDLDGLADGLAVHGENSHALRLLRQAESANVECIYIDPNYNTENDSFLFKDGYRRSTWLCMLGVRLAQARSLLRESGFLFCSIDEHETARLRELGEAVFGEDRFLAELIWDTKHSQQSGLFKPYHEHVQVFGRKPSNEHANFSGGSGEILAGAMKKLSSANPPSDFTFPAGTPWKAADDTELRQTWGDVETVELVEGRMVCSNGSLKYDATLRAGWTQKRQMEAFFAGQRPVVDSKGQEVIGFHFNSNGKLKIRKRRSKLTPKSLLPNFGTTAQATAALEALLGRDVFGRPKPVEMIRYLVGLPLGGQNSGGTVVDFFAGSGTTGHAVIDLNREDGGDRRFILVEMGKHFDTVLLPRLKKVAYSPEWEEGKPVRQATAEEAERSPRIMKVIRLESYEDTLNNLDVPTAEAGSANNQTLPPPPPPPDFWIGNQFFGPARAVPAALPARRRLQARRFASQRGAVHRPDGVHAQDQAARLGRESRDAGRPHRDVQLASRAPSLQALGAPADRRTLRA